MTETKHKIIDYMFDFEVNSNTLTNKYTKIQNCCYHFYTLLRNYFFTHNGLPFFYIFKAIYINNQQFEL